ncbi:hypothetical protein QJS04_geneDACA024740 [Acorus gramineus]|uniref:Uncharacterized protein n=1 Tax=Acorus gramineus TaxID=55184 RepID=A0AAV9BMH2_ACOGR|nr:hypothetical protein QJS04_geneDACA024740 [Acorus gramineus]
MSQGTLQEKAQTKSTLPMEHMTAENFFSLLELFSDSGMHGQSGGELAVVLQPTSLNSPAASEVSSDLLIDQANTSIAPLEVEKDKKKKKNREKKPKKQPISLTEDVAVAPPKQSKDPKPHHPLACKQGPKHL